MTTLAAGVAIALSTLSGAAATSAVASAAPTPAKGNYIHFPGRFYTDQASCTKDFVNFKNAVTKSGGRIGGQPVDADSEFTSCFLSTNGYTYDVAYTRAQPMFTADMKITGGFNGPTIVGGIRPTQTQAQYLAGYTFTAFEYGKVFNTLADCQKDFAPIDAKLKAAVKNGQISYTTPAPDNMDDPSAPSGIVRWSVHSCSSDDVDPTPGAKTFSYNVSWLGATNLKSPIGGASTYSAPVFNNIWYDAAGVQHYISVPSVKGKTLADGTWVASATTVAASRR